MKIKRQKQAKKTISFYKYNFSFREPFQILIDGTFCQAALKNKIQIKEQMPKYLMGEVQLCTTKYVHNRMVFSVVVFRVFGCCCFFLNPFYSFSHTVALWKNSILSENSFMEPKLFCRGSSWGNVLTSRTRFLRQSAYCPCWRTQTRTITLLPRRYI